MASLPDFEREGLLEGLDGPERSARLNLLRQLSEAGVSLDELRQAATQDRLALLPIQHFLDRTARYTLREYSAITGLSEEFLQRDYPALGLPTPQSDDRWFSDEQAVVGRTLKQVMDAGIPEQQIIDLARIVGRSGAVVAEALLQMIAEVFLKPGDTELDLGLRLVALAESLMPAVRPLIGNVVELHMRHLVNSEVIDRTTRATGLLPGSREVTVGFADLVGYTKLGEAESTERVGEIANGFASMASDVAEPPVRLIKLIGDAAMLVSTETAPLLDAVSRLIDAVDEKDGFPPLRAGIARGGAFRHTGDWYGRPVNLASRITGVAPSQSVIATREVCEAGGDGFRYDHWRDMSLKGIEGQVSLYRVTQTAAHS
jgi:adenylate cyclase